MAVVSQLLQLVSYLVLTRYFDATALGAFAQFNATLLLFLPWAALAFPAALALATTPEQRFYLSKLAVFATLFNALLVQLLFVVYFFSEPNPNPQLLYGPFLAICGAGFASLYEQKFLLAGQLKQQAAVVLLVAVFICAFRVLLALNGAELYWLLLSAIAQPVALAVFYYLLSAKNAEQQLHYRWADLTQTWQQFLVFPKYQASQQAFNAWSQSIPLLLFSFCFGLDVLAYLNLAILLLVAPSMLLNKAVGDVYYPMAARLLDNKTQLLLFLRQCTAALFMLLLLPFLLLGYYAEPIYAVLFGEQWRQAGEYCLWLMPWYFLVCLNAPALKTLIVLRQQKFSFYLNVLTFILRCAAIASGAFIFQSVWWALGLYGAVGCLHNLVIIGKAFVSATKLPVPQKSSGHAAN